LLLEVEEIGVEADVAAHRSWSIYRRHGENV
jgi:hypothetical protein